jgi:hypothetical protein
MESKYHAIITRNAVGEYFEPVALDQVIQANMSQDKLIYLLGSKPHFHFDDNKINESLAYVNSLHNSIIKLTDSDSTGKLQREAFGRISHAVQDFYAHSNYVDLWLEENGGVENIEPDKIDGLVDHLLHHPDLNTGDFKIWRDFIYYIPIINNIVKKIYIPKSSHEAMNLDSPERGIKFNYTMAAAQQRTLHEYTRIIKQLSDVCGREQVERFLGRFT